jgi:cyanophycin synthetase
VDSYDRGIYNVVYRYRDEACGLAAGREAVAIVERLFADEHVELDRVVARLKEVRDAHMLGPSTGSIVEAAKRRNIPYLRLTEDTSYIQLGHGHRQQRFQATVTGRTGIIGHGIADDKDWTKQILGDAGIPVPDGRVCDSWDAVEQARAISAIRSWSSLS